MRIFKNKNIKYKKYICELFRISQCKTRNEFRENQQPLGKFLFLFYMSEILINKTNIFFIYSIFYILYFLF